MLRTYYPLEFLTAYLNRAEDSKDLLNGVELAKLYNIPIKSIQFGKSNAEYTFDKAENCIYKGISSIKYCNSVIAEELLELSNNKYDNFVDLMFDIKTHTSVDSRQLKILTLLGFFNQFGNNKYLTEIIAILDRFYSSKKFVQQINKNNLEKFNVTEYEMKKFSNKETKALYKDIDIIGLIKYQVAKIPNQCFSIPEQMQIEDEFLGYVEYINPKVEPNVFGVTEFITFSDNSKPTITLRQICTGKEIHTKVKKPKLFNHNPFNKFSLLIINDTDNEEDSSRSFDSVFKSKKIGKDWVKTEETEQILINYEVIR